jgi:cytochrome P450
MTIIEQVGDDFLIPAYVAAMKETSNPFSILRHAHRNLLSIWPSECFELEVFGIRILRRQIFVANSPDSIKHVMVTHNDNYERKSPQMRRALENLLGDGLFISDGDTWKFRRRVIAPIVHKNRMTTFAPTMVETALDLSAQWHAHGDLARIDALVEMGSLTAEVISRSVFGKHLGRTSAHEVISGFSQYQRLIDQVNIGYFLGFDEGLPQIRGPRLRWAIKKVHDVIDRIIQLHLEGKGEEGSMVDTLLKVRDEETGRALLPTEIRSEAATIFMAGHETTANTLTWAWYLLSLAPWAEQKLHQELHDVLDGRPPTLEDIPKLRYTRAVIEETLRLYPPVPLLTRQARDADEIRGRRIEPAALVMVVPWLIHRHHKLWEHPHHFMPERFVEKKIPNLHAYVPFAIGPRICTGATFGLTESILCLATLAQQFKLRLAPGVKVEPYCRLSLRPRNGMPMVLHRRT